jgi:hypothetical protein
MNSPVRGSEISSSPGIRHRLILASGMIPYEMYDSSISAFAFERNHTSLIAMDFALSVSVVEKCGA